MSRPAAIDSQTAAAPRTSLKAVQEAVNETNRLMKADEQQQQENEKGNHDKKMIPYLKQNLQQDRSNLETKRRCLKSAGVCQQTCRTQR